MAKALGNDTHWWMIFLIFLRLGLTSFGGPVAHLGYFRNEFVVRRCWLSEHNYADLVALCQFLPGPSSSQVGMALGLSRAGYTGALAAWLGFTLPSAVILILFALGISAYGDIMSPGILHGLKIAAVAVVAQAVWGMAKNLCQGAQRATIMTVAACLALALPNAWGQVGAIVLAGLVGMRLFKPTPSLAHQTLPIPVSSLMGLIWLSLFLVLLIGLPILAHKIPNQLLAVIDAFYRTGSLVFGGGHVVLPLLRAEVVPSGWVGNDVFLAGYGATQALPGPLFTFAAFLGASMTSSPTGWLGGMVALLAIFTPSFLLMAGVLPFWENLRRNLRAQAALTGVNAAVVGLLLAAFYDPVWTSGIHKPTDFALALVAVTALIYWKFPPWLVVIGCGLIGWLLIAR